MLVSKLNYLENSYVPWDKNLFCQCSLLNPMRSLSTEAIIEASQSHPIACYYDAIIFLNQLSCVIIETPVVTAMA